MSEGKDDSYDRRRDAAAAADEADAARAEAMLTANKLHLPAVGEPGSGGADGLMWTGGNGNGNGGATSLALACYRGDAGRVRDILARDPEAAHEADDAGRTALHFAAYQSAAGAAQVLVGAVLDADVLRPFRATLRGLRERAAELERSLVSEEDHRLCEQYLREERERHCLDFEVQCTATACAMLARPDAAGCTPLHYAATTRDDTLVDLLRYPAEFARAALAKLATGGLVEAPASGGGSGTHSSSRQKHGKGRRIGGDEERAQRRRADAVRLASRRRSRKHLRRAVNRVDAHRNTALHFAAASGSTSASRELMRLGANHATINDSLQSPLDVCEDRTCRAALMRLPQAVDEACDADVALSNTAAMATTSMTGPETGLGSSSKQSTSAAAAARRRGGRSIKALLEHGESVNATSSVQGTTALHRSCARGSVDVTRDLLDAGADITATDSNGWSPLHCCAYYSTAEHGKIAKILLDKDVDVDARTLRQRTPLHLAVIQDHVSENLAGATDLSSAISASTASSSSSSLTSNRHAATTGEVDENTRTHRRMPEHKVRQTRHVSGGVVDMLELLARRGADLEARDLSGRTALHFAAKKGSPRVVQSLLVLGAEIYATTRNKLTCLHIAVEAARRPVVRLLVRTDAETRRLKTMRDSANRTAADVAPDQRTRDALVSLWEACEDGRLALVRKLLLDAASGGTRGGEAWNPVGIQDVTAPCRLTCLHLVARGAGKCYRDAKKAFAAARKRDRGARVDATQRALDAKMNGFQQIAKLLVRRGCSAASSDRYGMTPLMVAAQRGAVGLIPVMLSGEEDLLEREDKGTRAVCSFGVFSPPFSVIDLPRLLELYWDIVSPPHHLSCTHNHMGRGQHGHALRDGIPSDRGCQRPGGRGRRHSGGEPQR